MKIHFAVALAAVAIFVGGCASVPQQTVYLSQEAVSPQAGRVGVAMTALPKLDTQVPGAGCLLCLAAASFANSSLTAHAQTLPYEDLPKLKNEVADLLRKKGAVVTVIDEDLNISALADFAAKGPNIARKDFSPLQQKYKIDKLLVIDITALGFIRTYSSYIPTSDPKGLLQGLGYIVNLKNNTYDWYQPVVITKSTDQKWDEPPKFPGLTNAYFQALEIGRDSFLRPFAAEAVAAVTPTIGASAATPASAGATPAQSAPQ
jgi:hypothetical protein